MSDICYSIKVASKRTGLSPHVIRVWEKRYATISPARSGGNQRLYSDADIDRLILLKRSVQSGHSIGNIARLELGQLISLVQQAGQPPGAISAPTPRDSSSVLPAGDIAASFLEDAFKATSGLDAPAVERVLDEASVALGQIGMLNHVVAPLVHRIGEAWRRGELKVAHEHLATSVIRTFLGNVARPMALPHSAPALLVATPAGQLHELGAVLASACASAHGWRVVYVGPSLPAEEIVSAARQAGVRAVAISLVHPEDDPTLPTELARLRRLLPEPVAILAGGRACGAYRQALEATQAIVCASLDELTAALDMLRQGKH